MAPEDEKKTAFITEWGVHASNVMTFGLKNAPPTFQNIVHLVFVEFLTTFKRVFLDDFSVFGKKQEHLQHLKLCFQKCREYRLSLNLVKCAFAIKRGFLLEHINSEEGISIDPRKVEAIRQALESKTLKQLTKFFEQVKWHNRFLRYLAHVCVPLTKLTKKDVIFEWTLDQLRAFNIFEEDVSCGTSINCLGLEVAVVTHQANEYALQMQTITEKMRSVALDHSNQGKELEQVVDALQEELEDRLAIIDEYLQG
ncbi:hypothetical protein L7F22_067747 [Adiantum nelumboides]|nr:hypothetical protein [Adiantum nelumboides]